MKNTNSEENLNRNSVPILSWDFHYEFMNELKAIVLDLKKVKQISNQFNWNEENLDIKERIKDETILVTDLDLRIVFASKGIKKMTGYTEEEFYPKPPLLCSLSFF